MDQENMQLQPSNSPGASVVRPSQDDTAGALGARSCPACGASAQSIPATYIYALGRIEARFPSIAVEKEFAQITRRSENEGKTDNQVFHRILAARENRYLTRQMCWVMKVQGIETYVLHPRDPADFELLIGAIRPDPGPGDIDLVIGLQGPLAPPESCNGLSVPIVAFDQIYSFSRDAIIGAIPKPEQASTEQFRPAAEEVFDRIVQLTDNAGATDEQRALNYLAVRYPAIYARTAEQFVRDFSLVEVAVRFSRVSDTRRIADIIFSFTNRTTDFNEKFFVRVDVTEEFPFLSTKWSPYLVH